MFLRKKNFFHLFDENFLSPNARWKIFVKVKNCFFFWNAQKNHVFRKNIFPPFWRRFLVPTRAGTLKIFVKKVNYFFFWKHDFWAFQKKIIFHFFDHMYSTCQTPLAPRGAPLTPHGSPLTLHESYQTYPGSPTNAHGWNPIYILFSFCMSIGRHPMNRL